MKETGRGVYILVMQLGKPVPLTIGRLGSFDFPAGFYLYVGSAFGGFNGRINRHLRKNKKSRWHIDYLLEEADLMWVDLFETDSDEAECKLSCKIAGLSGAKIISPGFGSSDCSCRTHLYFFKRMPAVKIKL